jgi:hypothetical protein
LEASGGHCDGFHRAACDIGRRLDEVIAVDDDDFDARVYPACIGRVLAPTTLFDVLPQVHAR